MIAEDALKALAAREWDGPDDFAARHEFSNALSRWHEASGGMLNLLGTRVHPFAHQLYAVRTVLAEEWPRYLLADEVGLGKTVEAGLVLQALRGFHTDLRVLVVSPGAMVRQWLCELFLRFSEQVFALVDVSRLALDEAGPLLDFGRVIVSFTALEARPSLKDDILERDWDLVIIDEVHQVQPPSELYDFLRKLSSASKGVLGLSATPSRRDLDGVCDLLALIDPANTRPTELRQRLADGEGCERIVCVRRSDVTMHGTKLCHRAVKPLRYRISNEERQAVEHLERHPQPDGADQVALTALYRQKASSSPFVLLELLEARKTVLNEGPGDTETVVRPEASLLRDPGPEEEDHLRRQLIAGTPPLPDEEAWLQAALKKVRDWMEADASGTSRFLAVSDWIRSRLNQNQNAKVLVFAGDWSVVEDFGDHLAQRLGHHRVAQIHYRLDEVTHAQESLRFQRQQSCAVLVSDELGGEGRNFEFAAAVVHLDLPWSPSRLEQRIGRLDRIGRDPNRPVLSVIPSGCATTESALLDLHAGALGVFQESLGGLEFLLAQLHERILKAFLSGPRSLRDLCGEVIRHVKEERERNEVAPRLGRLDPQRFQRASQHANAMSRAEPEQDERAICRWMELIGGRSERVQNGGTLLSLDDSHLPEPTPGALGSRIRRAGTFRRRQALRNESLEFFAPGHPLVDALIHDVLSSFDGRVSALARDLGEPQAGDVFLLVTGWSGAHPEQLTAPHRVVCDPQCPRLQRRVVRIGTDDTVPDELAASIVAPHHESDRDLPRAAVTFSADEVHATFERAMRGVEFDVDSMALIVGYDSTLT